MALINIEVCTFTLESAIIAEKAGANRIELCENMLEGGTTPSYGNIKLAKSKLNIPINVMIRPRGGDFLYSELEFEIMKHDVEVCKTIGVSGVVFGILLSDGNVDVKRCIELVKMAKPLSVTFHRAFDKVQDPFKALEDIISCGFNTILTSGLEVNALEGASLIAKLIEKAKDRIIVMPGGGVREDNVVEIIKTTHAIEVHTSAKTSIASQMIYHNPNISLNTSSAKDENKVPSVNPNVILDMKTEIIKCLKP